MAKSNEVGDRFGAGTELLHPCIVSVHLRTVKLKGKLCNTAKKTKKQTNKQTKNKRIKPGIRIIMGKKIIKYTESRVPS